jgi:uncharacterized protein YbjT (DUF2867 family)
MISPVTVVGGAGRTGRLVAEELLAAGVEVRVASRSATRTATDLVARGAAAFDVDVRQDGPSLAAALADTAAVVYSVEPGTANSGPNRPETTMYQGVQHVLAHCAAPTRFVLVSSIYVTRSEHQFNEWGRLLDWRLRGEDAVRASGLPYTVVRPGWLVNDRSRRGVRLEQGDRGDGQITRADVARACVQALVCTQAIGVTFELFNRSSGPAPADWEPLFAKLTRDTDAAELAG